MSPSFNAFTPVLKKCFECNKEIMDSLYVVMATSEMYQNKQYIYICQDCFNVSAPQPIINYFKNNIIDGTFEDSLSKILPRPPGWGIVALNVLQYSHQKSSTYIGALYCSNCNVCLAKTPTAIDDWVFQHRLFSTWGCTRCGHVSDDLLFQPAC